MIRLLFLALAIITGLTVSAQVGIGVNFANLDPSAELDVSSTTKGFLVPRMTSSQRLNIVSPASGLLLYQTNAPVGFYYYSEGNWKLLEEQNISLKLNVLDTAVMLSSYARVQRVLDSLNSKLSKADTASMLSSYAQIHQLLDSLLSVQSKLNLKLNISDSALMLDSRFAKDTVSLSRRINTNKQAIIDTASNLRAYANLKVNIADTANMLDSRFAKDTASLSTRINTNKQAIIDTASNLRSYANLKVNIADTANMLDSRFAKDTVSLSTRINTNKQAIKDSASNLRNYANLKVNIADTANMLDSRFAKDTISLSSRIDTNKQAIKDSASNLRNYANLKVNIADTANMLDSRFAKDTASLSTRINTNKQAIIDTASNLRAYANLKVNIADTANMLDNRFARDTASLSARIDEKLNISDTATMLDNRFARDTVSLSSRIDERLNISDTASMLDNRFAKDTMSLSYRIDALTAAAIDTSSLSNRIDLKLNIADTASMLDNRFAKDTVSLSNRIDQKLNIADTASMLDNRFAKDTVSLSNRIDQKLNISDTATMLDNRFAKDTASLSARIDEKLNISDTSTMLYNRFARDTASLSARIDEKLNISDTSTMLDNRFARDTASLSSRINLKLSSADTASLSMRIDSLRPMSSGDIVYGGTDGVPTRLSIGDDGQVLTLTNGLPIWTANNGVTTVGPISATATATGAYIASNTLHLAPADADNAGIVSTATQTFAGEKTFNSDLTVNGKITSSNTDRSTFAGKLTVGTNSDTTSSAVLEASSTTQGFLPPRLTTTQRDAITTPVAGLTIWNATNTQLEVYDGSYWKNMVGLLVSPLNVGDPYGGGKVFYIFGPSDNGFIKGQTHGLIAATEDQTTDAGVKWFPDKFYGATGTYIGLGLPNTLAIITSAIVTGTTNMSSFAAGLANSYRGGGYIDWFLPSKDELNLLYQARDSIGGFATSGIPGYWSSTQKGGISFTNFTSFANGVTNARLQFFYTGGTPVQTTGTITDTGIENLRRVRAIRIF